MVSTHLKRHLSNWIISPCKSKDKKDLFNKNHNRTNVYFLSPKRNLAGKVCDVTLRILGPSNGRVNEPDLYINIYIAGVYICPENSQEFDGFSDS